MVYPALLPLMRTPRLPVVGWTDAPADLNWLVRFVERRNLVSARVPSHFNWTLQFVCSELQRTWTGKAKYLPTPEVRRLTVWQLICDYVCVRLIHAWLATNLLQCSKVIRGPPNSLSMWRIRPTGNANFITKLEVPTNYAYSPIKSSSWSEIS